MIRLVPFAEIIKGLQPAKGLFDLAKAMLRDAWDARLVAAHGDKEAIQAQLRETERQIEGLLDRIVDASSASIVSAYESRIEKLERKKNVLDERLEKSVPKKGRLEDCIELSLKFLSKTWFLYEKGDHVMRQAILRLAFSEPLRYAPNGVYRAPE